MGNSTVFLCITPSVTPGHVQEIQRLQNAIDEKYRQLEVAKHARQRAEETKRECIKETEWIVTLPFETVGVPDGLRELGKLLQKEKQLSEQLNPHVSATRDQKKGLQRSASNDLEEMEECVSAKEKSLSSQIIETELALAEARARCLAAKALLEPPIGKQKRKRNIKHK